METKSQAVKRMLIVAGAGSTGKSTTVKQAWQLILKSAISYQGVTDASHLYITPKEIGVVVSVAEKIGIASRGDTKTHVQEGLDFFLLQRCGVIVCATRSGGGSFKVAESFGIRNGYAITVLHKLKYPDPDNYELENGERAKQIHRWAKNALGI
jgi:hypothetical protein